MRGAWSHVLFLSNTEEFTSFPLWQASAGRANELGSQKPWVKTPPGRRRRLLMLEAGQVADHCGGEWGDRGTLRGAGKASWNRHRVILARGLRCGPDQEQRGWRRGAPGCARGCSQTRPRPGACVRRVLPLPFRPHVPPRGLLGVGRCCPCASGLGGECSLHLIHKSERYVQFLVDGRKVEGPSPIPRPRRSRPCPCTKEPHSSRKGRYI